MSAPTTAVTYLATRLHATWRAAQARLSDGGFEALRLALEVHERDVAALLRSGVTGAAIVLACRECGVTVNEAPLVAPTFYRAWGLVEERRADRARRGHPVGARA